MKKCGSILILLLLIFNQILNGQTIKEPTENFNPKINLAEVALTFASPLKGFKERYGKQLVGFDATYLRQMKNEQPIFLLGRFTYFPMESHETGIGTSTTIRIASHFIGLELGARYYLPIKLGILEFYGEIGLGSNNLYALNSFIEEGESTQTNTVLSDSALKYSSGLGMNVKAGFGYLFIKSSYQNGVSAKYLKLKNDIPIGLLKPDQAFFQTKSSQDVIKWDIGYTFVF